MGFGQSHCSPSYVDSPECALHSIARWWPEREKEAMIKRKRLCRQTNSKKKVHSVSFLQDSSETFIGCKSDLRTFPYLLEPLACEAPCWDLGTQNTLYITPCCLFPRLEPRRTLLQIQNSKFHAN